MQDWLQKKHQHLKQEQFAALLKQMEGITFTPNINKSTNKICQNVIFFCFHSITLIKNLKKFGKDIQFDQRTKQMQEEKKERLKKLEDKVKSQFNYKPSIN